MLKTRLWMGSLLIAVAALFFLEERWTAPYFPVLLVASFIGLLLATRELVGLLNNRPRLNVCLIGVAAVVLSNWVPVFVDVPPWSCALAAFTGAFLLVLLVELRAFSGVPGGIVDRIALSTFTIAYLGLLPSFIFQIRFLPSEPGVFPTRAAWSLLLMIAVVKGNDIGAYFTGRLIGRHKMTPFLSPKKTWEGAAGGMLASVLLAALIVKSGNLGSGSLLLAVGFGLTVGLAGMLGDLAESLIKRDSGTKDASSSVPGFGGVLDVLDSLLFAGPVAYLWLK